MESNEEGEEDPSIGEEDMKSVEPPHRKLSRIQEEDSDPFRDQPLSREIKCRSLPPNHSFNPSKETAKPLTRPPKLADLKAAKDVHKVRSYSLTKKGLVNEGEHYVSRSPSELSLSSTSSLDTSMSIMAVEPYKVLLLGASGVGKRALIHEFMDPDTMIHYFQSSGKSWVRHCVLLKHILGLYLGFDESNLDPIYFDVFCADQLLP